MPIIQTTNLVIDVGNTLTKIALYIGDELLSVDKFDDLSCITLKNIYSNYKVDRVIVSNVGENFTECEEFLSSQSSFIKFSSETPLPIKNCYKTQDTLGSDRLAAAVGANAQFPNRNVLAIDSGTALTYELVSSKGEYFGGAISPGILMRFKALNYYTAKLPLLYIDETYQLIGSDTKNSILSGVLNGVVNEVDGYINSVREQFSPLEIVFTGGDSFFFDKKLKNSIFVHPNLVLFGLNRILNYNEHS
jgi:type III pantothenate kinase